MRDAVEHSFRAENKLVKAVSCWTPALEPHATTHQSPCPTDLNITLVRWYSILRSLHCEETNQVSQQDYALNKLISMAMITCFSGVSISCFSTTWILSITHIFKATKQFSCEQSETDKRTSLFKTSTLYKKKETPYYYHCKNWKLPPTCVSTLFAKIHLLRSFSINLFSRIHT